MEMAGPSDQSLNCWPGKAETSGRPKGVSNWKISAGHTPQSQAESPVKLMLLKPSSLHVSIHNLS